MVTWNEYKQMEHKRKKNARMLPTRKQIKENWLRIKFETKILESRNRKGYFFLGFMELFGVILVGFQILKAIMFLINDTTPSANTVMWLFLSVLIFYIPATAVEIVMPKPRK